MEECDVVLRVRCDKHNILAFWFPAPQKFKWHVKCGVIWKRMIGINLMREKMRDGLGVSTSKMIQIGSMVDIYLFPFPVGSFIGQYKTNCVLQRE